MFEQFPGGRIRRCDKGLDIECKDDGGSKTLIGNMCPHFAQNCFNFFFFAIFEITSLLASCIQCD